MYDVARLAGVSHQTVSRVINGSRHVRPETRDRVVAAMQQLDYRPNSVARALVTGSSKTLGVVTFNTTLFGPASTLVGVERAATPPGYCVSIVSLERWTARGLRAVERLRAIGRGRRAVIAPQVAATGALWICRPASRRGRRGGHAGRASRSSPVDQYEGARLATEHLLGLGHATVHHLAGPAGLAGGRPARSRAGGTRWTAAGAAGARAAARGLEPALGLRARAPAARAATT